MTRAGRIVACVVLAFAASARAQLSISPQSAGGSSGQTINVDVTIANPGAVPIDAFGFQLSYPAALLDYQTVSAAGTLTQSWIVVGGSENVPGVVQIGGFDLSPMSGSGVLLRVTFTVQSSILGSGPLAISNFVDDVAGASTTNATFQVTVTEGTTGLFASYYNNIDFTGALLQRVDPVVNFDWGNGSPDPSMGTNDFSIRWTGWVLPDFSQTYTFYTITDDGVRLWVNDQLIVDYWIDQPATERSGTIALTAGTPVPIKMEFFENAGEAVAILSWSSPSRPKQLIPQDHLFASQCAQGLGDVDASGVLGASDVGCAFDIYLAGQNALAGCNYPSTACELESADVNCDGSVTPADARAIEIRRAASLAPAPCFAAPDPPPSPPYGIGLVQDVVDDGGTTRLSVRVVVADGTDLDAFGARLSFPTAQLQLNRVEAGFHTTSWYDVGGRENAPGQLTLGGFDASSTAPAGIAEVCRVWFDFVGAPGPVGGLSLSNFVDDFVGAVVGPVTAADLPRGATHRLHQNYPNPFNPTTHVRYDVAGGAGERVHVRIAVYDVRGALVRTLVDHERRPGAYAASWDGRDDRGAPVASGVYFCSMRAGGYAESRRMVLLK